LSHIDGNDAGLATQVRCADCGAAISARSMQVACAECGGLLVAEHRDPAVAGNALRELFDARARASALGASALERSGVWRFRELVLPDAGDAVISQPEGNTPLLARDAIAEYAGVPSLLVKHEGHNPTGSFKDRGMTVAITQARRVGARAVACASTGNTSASLSAYAALAGIPAVVFVPEGAVAAGKLAQTVAYGAHTLRIRGDFDECLRLAREASDTLGVYLVNSVNPFRVEGQKTIVLELLQQRRWRAPDWIALPAGNLGNTSAFGKALAEARQWGLIDRMPRLLAVQAAGAAPFARGFAERFTRRVRVQAETRATAIRIGDPASWKRAVKAIEETGGVVEAVTDADIFEAKRVVDRCGVGCEPASAASVAGVRALVARGMIRPDEEVVAVLTGHLLKDPGAPPETTAGARADEALTPAEALMRLERIVAHAEVRGDPPGAR
jgi:threonine synthase